MSAVQEEYVHETSNGLRIPISKVSNAHLMNIIRFIELRAREGVTVPVNYGSGDIEETWEEELYDEKAQEFLGLNHYTEEAERRGLIQ